MWEYTETELWRIGENNVSLLHVFGLTAVGKIVLAFAEARFGTGKDADCPHDIWMRRSTDGGKTFCENICLVKSGETGCYTNPVPVYDEKIGRLFLFYSDNIGNAKTENYIIFSDDLGLNWSKPCNITGLLNDFAKPFVFHLAGPGHGLQLKHGPNAGRLIVPFWHRLGLDKPKNARDYCASLIYSDDDGKTWLSAAEKTAVDCGGSESRIVETKDGLLWNFRTLASDRYVCTSKDSGITWSKTQHMDINPTKTCDSGLINLTDKPGYENVVLFSRVSQPDKRNDMEILISFDGGVTFSEKMSLPIGDAIPGYSDLCIINDGSEQTVGLIHCRNNHILFSRISLEALTGGKYDNTVRTVTLNI